METTILQANALSKHYGPIKALNNFSLEVNPGQVWGVLGPNGSGKSTFLGIILRSLHAKSGTFSWFGDESNANRLRIGSLLESPNFLPYLNAVDNLKIVARIKRTDYSNIDEVLKKVNLFERRMSPFKTYSLGMKQRLAIAATLIGDPEVLILDEPTNGLDPEGISEIRSLILDLQAANKTIIMASHILVEVEKVCSHVAILKKGHLLAAGKVGSLLQPRKQIILKANNEALMDILSVTPGVENITRSEGKFSFEVDLEFKLEELLEYISQKGILLTGIEENKMSLEDEFLTITKNSK